MAQNFGICPLAVMLFARSNMETARVIQSYVAVLVWPLLIFVAMIIYRDVIRSLLPGAKVKLTILGIAIETTIPVIERSIAESVNGESLTNEQKEWLMRLKNGGEETFDQSQLSALRPLRNAGLVKNHPPGFLQEAKLSR